MRKRRTAVYAAALVAFYVYQPGHLTLSVGEHVRLDRLVHSPTDGFTVQRHGDLIGPGTTRIPLVDGVYYLRLGADASLIVPDDGSVVVQARTQDEKDPWPESPPPPPPAEFDGLAPQVWAEHGATTEGRGVGVSHRLPTLVVTYVSRDRKPR